VGKFVVPGGSEAAILSNESSFSAPPKSTEPNDLGDCVDRVEAKKT